MSNKIVLRVFHSLPALFIVAYGVRVLFAVWCPIPYGDDDGSYTQYATNYLKGLGWVNFRSFYEGLPVQPFRAWVPPLYPALLTLYFKWISTNLQAFRWILAAFGAGTCVMTAQMAECLMDRRKALWAGWILCFYLPHIFWSTRLLPESPVIFFSVTAVWLLLKARTSGRIVLALSSGFFFSLANYGRSEFFPLILVCMVWTVWRELTKRTAALALALFLGFALPLTPWVIRNAHLFHRLLLTTTNYGDGWLVAHCPAYNLEFTMFTLSPPQVEGLRGAGEIEIADRAFGYGLAYIRDFPGIFVLTAIGNFLVFWRPQLSFSMPWKANVAYTLFSGTLLCFFLYGLQEIFQKKLSRGWWLLVGIIGYKSFLHLFYYIVNRFREAVVPFILVIAVLGLFAWLDSQACESS